LKFIGLPDTLYHEYAALSKQTGGAPRTASLIFRIIQLIDNSMAGVSDSPERLAKPERESPAEAETLPKMSTFWGKAKGM